MTNEERVLCAASYYEQKFYLNPLYDKLPRQIKDELKIMCVLFVDEVSGIIMLQFDEHGQLHIVVTAKDSDMYFDEIGSKLKIKQLQNEKKELFTELEEYYGRVVCGHEH